MSSSGRRSRSRRAGGSLSSSSSMSISEEQISDLMSKLQALLPDSSQAARSGAHRGSASRVLQETCSYIRSLHREVDDLSEMLAALLGSDAVTADQAALIRSLLLM